MKNLYTLLIAFFALALVNLTAQPIKAGNDNEQVPLNSNIRTGKLENGLRYYILKNSKPEKRMELRLALQAGSVDEDDDQKGLAHMLEHMCFNGTENFPKNKLIDFLQKTGVRFGAHLNAYTSFDETVYMLMLPSDKKSIVKDGMKVLSDWAGKVSNENEEIDKERGVIVEEIRLRSNPQMRIYQDNAPELFRGAKYSYRFPGGDTNIIRSFEYDVIKRFYRDWYRPDLMSVIAVGDFDVNDIEDYVKDYFSDLKNPANPRKPEDYRIPEIETLKTLTKKDKELTQVTAMIVHSGTAQDRGTFGEYYTASSRNAIDYMFNQRLQEKLMKNNPPYVNAGGSKARSLGHSDDFTVFATLRQEDPMYGINILLTEIFRAYKNGFTESELERAKTEILSSMEQLEKEKDNMPSSSLAMELVRHVLENEPVPGILADVAYNRQFMERLTVEEANRLFKEYLTPGKAMILVMGPEESELPTEQEIMDAYNGIASKNIEAYKDVAANKALFTKNVTPGTIKSEKTDAKTGVVTYTLSNGAKVLVKPTDFKADEILFSAFSMGGSSLVDDENFKHVANASSVIDLAGIGEFDNTTLQKMLTGKQISISPYISTYQEGFSGNSSPKDLETFMQLLHMYFTDPRKDSEAFEAFKTRYRDGLLNRGNNPNAVFADSVNYFLSGYHKRAMPPKAENLEKIDLDALYNLYRERFSNAGDFTFVFVGNVNNDEFLPLVNKYIGSLPGTNQAEKFKDLGMNPPKGKFVKEVRKGIEQKSQVQLRFTGDFKFTYENYYYGNALAEYLSNKLRESLREEMGGVYGVGVYFSGQYIPSPRYQFIVSFGCNPDRVDELVAEAKKIMEEAKKVAADADNLLKIKETHKREHEVNLKENGKWLDWIVNSELTPITLSYGLENREKLVANLTAKNLTDAAKQYLNFGELKELILYPEQKN